MKSFLTEIYERELRTSKRLLPLAESGCVEAVANATASISPMTAYADAKDAVARAQEAIDAVEDLRKSIAEKEELLEEELKKESEVDG